MTSRNVEFISEQKFLLFVPDRAMRAYASRRILHSRVRNITCVGSAKQLELIVCPSRESLVTFLRSMNDTEHAKMKVFVNEGHGTREIPKDQFLST